mmetsp:Transcript_58094/g.155278  ORF Transcript_58094/g.155278 Transcript_58094/m.155278 type:complete len:435 (-) Transcript_58094:165-1469(-)
MGGVQHSQDVRLIHHAVHVRIEALECVAQDIPFRHPVTGLGFQQASVQTRSAELREIQHTVARYVRCINYRTHLVCPCGFRQPPKHTVGENRRAAVRPGNFACGCWRVGLGNHLHKLFSTYESITVQINSIKHTLHLLQLPRAELHRGQQQHSLNEVRRLRELRQPTNTLPLLTLSEARPHLFVRHDPPVMQRHRCRGPLRRVLDHQLTNQVSRLARASAPPCFGWELHAAPADRLAAGVHVLAVKRHEPAQQLVHAGADAPEVRRVAKWLVRYHLRSHVVHRSGDLMYDMRPASIKNSGQAEINHLCYTRVPVRSGQHDVLRLHIPVHHPHAVTIGRRHEGVANDTRHELLLKGLVGPARELLAVPAFDGLQDEVEHPIGLVVAVLVQPNHVGVVQSRKGTDLQQTSLDRTLAELRSVHGLAHPHLVGVLLVP